MGARHRGRRRRPAGKVRRPRIPGRIQGEEQRRPGGMTSPAECRPICEMGSILISDATGFLRRGAHAAAIPLGLSGARPRGKLAARQGLRDLHRGRRPLRRAPRDSGSSGTRRRRWWAASAGRTRPTCCGRTASRCPSMASGRSTPCWRCRSGPGARPRRSTAPRSRHRAVRLDPLCVGARHRVQSRIGFGAGVLSWRGRCISLPSSVTSKSCSSGCCR